MDVTRTFYNHSKILVAALNGPAVGLSAALVAMADFVYAVCGALLFSGYVVFDTYLILHRLSPDEYIVGAINLYLE